MSCKTMIDGATPKVIKSAKLSSCLPNSPLTFNNLASKPSKKSKNKPDKIKKLAVVKSD